MMWDVGIESQVRPQIYLIAQRQKYKRWNIPSFSTTASSCHYSAMHYIQKHLLIQHCLIRVSAIPYDT
jgi:hypothetical protein